MSGKHFPDAALFSPNIGNLALLKLSIAGISERSEKVASRVRFCLAWRDIDFPTSAPSGKILRTPG